MQPAIRVDTINRRILQASHGLVFFEWPHLPAITMCPAQEEIKFFSNGPFNTGSFSARLDEWRHEEKLTATGITIAEKIGDHLKEYPKDFAILSISRVALTLALRKPQESWPKVLPGLLAILREHVQHNAAFKVIHRIHQGLGNSDLKNYCRSQHLTKR